MGGVDRVWIAWAGLQGAVAVAAAAYASHGLAGVPQAQDWARTASQMQLWHALALIAAALCCGYAHGVARIALRAAGWLFLVGGLLFCGSLYGLAFERPLPLPMAAPAGGMALILGWVAVAVAALAPEWVARRGS
ncbi:DUF423 domain-containing protein [Azospirillum sp. RWY-5-1]|uniref:DUF423 domain-containing protein n=2 Tax=Azospirillum oleiclasticum TaxID=2735135 RepID=A0ABX2TEM7_9PROT|nr:DUF423 domain-containing protein [Azospirillum oleiclasticum]NYZ22802.1 DUF423 domain-containing protein [Azospirillum oleiclasticum]